MEQIRLQQIIVLLKKNHRSNNNISSEKTNPSINMANFRLCVFLIIMILFKH